MSYLSKDCLEVRITKLTMEVLFGPEGAYREKKTRRERERETDSERERERDVCEGERMTRRECVRCVVQSDTETQ